VAFVLDEGDHTDGARWGAGLREAGAPEVRVVIVSRERPPYVDDLDGATGVYVAGGLTPTYREVLVDGGIGWLEPVRAADLPYAGFSAGAAIAAVHALVGGYRTAFRERQIDVCHEDCAENLDAITVLPGLGLVPFVVDVHAAQWGTHYRLVHALLGAGLNEGWAIDEHTCVEVADGVATVHGDGAATRVRRVADRVELSVHVADGSVVLGQ
jgi:cyanophycinase